MRFWYYVLKATAKHMFGRWYVWRDTPTDVVRKFAALKRVMQSEGDADLNNLIMQADAEAKLRKRK